MGLKHESKNVWKNLKDDELKLLMEYGDRYISFLDNSKTERRCADEIVRLAKSKGFVDFDKILNQGEIKPGMKILLKNKEKSVALVIIGKENLEKGMNIVGAHIDAPRLDLKPFPLYEEGNMALLKTHYYGGVKKYQWTCIPLSLHGVVFTKDGNKVDISIGENSDEPIFYINDLLIHLSADQMQKKLSEGITGEQLNVVVGHIPMISIDADEKELKDPVKENILKILNDKYGIIEEDFMLAEFEIVPADKARHVGLDSSMISAHGHDDRVCSYAGLEAIFDVENPEITAVSLFVDKEEIGSVGNTSMESKFFENMIAELIALQGDYSDLKVRRAFANSKVLSADVTVGFDPTFPDVLDKKNAAMIGHGVTISKYTGSRGKGGCNDANSEYLSYIRKIFDENEIIWQIGELGKVDQGGGGTIAYILAQYGAEVVDCGVPMLSMHAPLELVSKADIYMTYKAYSSFLK